MLFTATCYGTAVLLGSQSLLLSALPRWLARSMFIVGERSYTIYLLHFPCMLVGWTLLVAVRPEWTMHPWTYAWAQPLASALLLVPLTEFSYRCLELPGTALAHL